MKRKIKTLAALLVAGSAWAWICVVMMVAVVCFAAILVYNLVDTIHQVLPDNPHRGPATNVTQIRDIDLGYTYWSDYDGDTGSGASASFAESVPVGFSISYGITDAPWVETGSASASRLQTPYVMDGDNVTYTMFGPGVKIGVVSRPSGGSWSDSSFTILERDSQSYRVVIERSGDLQGWTPVFTNAAYSRFAAESWVDENPLPDRGYYRLRFDGVSAGIPIQ